MSYRCTSLSLLLLASFSVKANTCASLDEIAWILGEWESSSSKQNTLEIWTKASDTTFEGMTTVKQKENFNIINNESMRIVKMNKGIFYIAKVEHNDLPIAFKLIRCATGFALFENHNHDFPKRIAYRLESKNKLLAVIEGDKGKGFHITYERAGK